MPCIAGCDEGLLFYVCVDVLLEEDPDNPRIAPEGWSADHAESIIVPGIAVGTLFRQQLHYLNVPFRRRIHQGSSAERVPHVHLGAIFEQ